LVFPIRDHTCFEQPQFERLLGNNFLQVLRFAPELLDLVGRGSRNERRLSTLRRHVGFFILVTVLPQTIV
jgi:hypothetical protein